MNSEILGSMYEYGVWANERLFAQAATLTDAGHSPGDLDYALFCRTAR